MPSADNKRIAKNTMFLYIRMLLSIGVNLYTVRVIWQVLGVDNYGIYNVVGGIVLMFAFLQNAMVASSQRFISFELGKGSNGNLQKVFSLSLTVHFLLAIVILVLAETIGLWFLNYKMNIPPDRMIAANWVYQCSILAFCVAVISVPYSASIVAHEHMKAYGYFGIIDVILRLLIVFALVVIPFDKLIVYAILVLSVSLIMRLINSIYCRSHFPACHYKHYKDKHLIKDMLSFAGWSFIGNMGFSVRDQGLNILINLFFNVAVNAAKGVASQVGGVVYGFASSFQMAMNPQITKKYAAGNKEEMMKLVFIGCRFSVLLMMLIAIPLIVSAEPVLKIWLGDVAPYTVGFLQLSLTITLIDSIVGPITTALQAIGKIKKFQIVISIIMVSNIPLAWLWLYLGGSPYSVMMVSIITSLIAIFARLLLLKEQIDYSIRTFFNKVIFPLILTFVVAAPCGYLLFPFFSHSILGLILYGLSTVSVTALFALFVGMTKSERSLVRQGISRYLHL